MTKKYSDILAYRYFPYIPRVNVTLLPLYMNCIFQNVSYSLWALLKKHKTDINLLSDATKIWISVHP